MSSTTFVINAPMTTPMNESSPVQPPAPPSSLATEGIPLPELELVRAFSSAISQEQLTDTDEINIRRLYLLLVSGDPTHARQRFTHIARQAVRMSRGGVVGPDEIKDEVGEGKTRDIVSEQGQRVTCRDIVYVGRADSVCDLLIPLTDTMASRVHVVCIRDRDMIHLVDVGSLHGFTVRIPLDNGNTVESRVGTGEATRSYCVVASMAAPIVITCCGTTFRIE
jgi:hypothetical protein